MTFGDIMTRAARAFEFGRRMPAAKLARRIELTLRRSLRDRLNFAARPSVGGLRRRVSPPLPIFAPRRGLCDLNEGVRRFSFIGRAEAVRGPGMDWTLPGAGPSGQLWRMNLHYMEYLEEVADAQWAALVADWINGNPSGARGAWRDGWNSYTISLRSVVWMQQLAQRRQSLAAPVVAAAQASLAEQLSFLERNLETDLSGNHLVKNVKALIWASAFFDGVVAEQWRARGLSLLAKVLDEQVLADGAHYERSPSYHCQVFADLLEIRHALGGDKVGGALDAALMRMAQATADLAHPDGGVALFNDAGLSMAYRPADCLSVYAQIFGTAPTARRVFALEAAGYYGLRTDRVCFIADCGRLMPDDLPAHGHGDALSFEWSVDGERIIVDQGVFEYVAGNKRCVSRAAASHNTLCLEGADQADFFGAFRCGRRPNVETRRWEPHAAGFLLEGAHDGFAHLPGRPLHVRRLVVSADALDIVDRVEGLTDRRVFLNFLLHPGVDARVVARGIELRRGAVRIVFESSAPFEVVPAAWWPDMGVELPTNRIVVAWPLGETEARSIFRLF